MTALGRIPTFQRTFKFKCFVHNHVVVYLMIVVPSCVVYSGFQMKPLGNGVNVYPCSYEWNHLIGIPTVHIPHPLDRDQAKLRVQLIQFSKWIQDL